MKGSRLFLVISLAYVCSSCVSKEDAAISGLIERIVPDHNSQFRTEIISSENGSDVFEIGSDQGKVVLRGNNAVSLASALNWYLKYYCNSNISDCGSRMDLPAKLPLPEQEIRKSINGNYRFQFNYCTFNYTASWWDWEQWEKKIDFMAMNGINMPLMVVGLEGVWYNSLIRVGYTDKEASSFLTGPAYFAWQWMTNIQSYGGPLPGSWIDSHIWLGKRIMDRCRELGMYPVQQGFSGYVPRDFRDKFPDARIMLKPEWYGFKGTAQLDPLDPLFEKFGRIFMEEQEKLFGKGHFYATDPFHESEPPVKTEESGFERENKINKFISNEKQNFATCCTGILPGRC